MKKTRLFLTVLSMTAVMSITALAGEWKQDAVGWWYQNDDGSYSVNQWQWIDGNHDGIAECYYFNENGYCLMDTTTPDQYFVNADGAWVVDGVICTKAVEASAPAQSSAAAAEAPAKTAEAQSDQPSSSESANWPGSYPYVEGMTATRPTNTLGYYTVNISTGKYHSSYNVPGLLEENTRYFIGPASALEDHQYTKCKRRGCY